MINYLILEAFREVQLDEYKLEIKNAKVANKET